MSLKWACIFDESSPGKVKTFSTTRIRTCILVHNLAGYLTVLSSFDEKSLYQHPNERVPFYIRKLTNRAQYDISEETAFYVERCAVF